MTRIMIIGTHEYKEEYLLLYVENNRSKFVTIQQLIGICQRGAYPINFDIYNNKVEFKKPCFELPVYDDKKTIVENDGWLFLVSIVVQKDSGKILGYKFYNPKDKALLLYRIDTTYKGMLSKDSERLSKIGYYNAKFIALLNKSYFYNEHCYTKEYVNNLQEV